MNAPAHPVMFSRYTLSYVLRLASYVFGCEPALTALLRDSVSLNAAKKTRYARRRTRMGHCRHCQRPTPLARMPKPLAWEARRNCAFCESCLKKPLQPRSKWNGSRHFLERAKRPHNAFSVRRKFLLVVVVFVCTFFTAVSSPQSQLCDMGT